MFFELQLRPGPGTRMRVPLGGDAAQFSDSEIDESPCGRRRWLRAGVHYEVIDREVIVGEGAEEHTRPSDIAADCGARQQRDPVRFRHEPERAFQAIQLNQTLGYDSAGSQALFEFIVQHVTQHRGHDDLQAPLQGIEA